MEKINKEENNMEEQNKENEEIVELDNEIKTENDTIKISDDVVAVIAGVAVSEVPGVAGMAGGFAGGISEVFSGKKNLAKGIKVEIDESFIFSCPCVSCVRFRSMLSIWMRRR